VRILDRSAPVSRAPTHGPGPDTHLEEDELVAADHASVFRKYTNTSRSRSASVNIPKLDFKVEGAHNLQV